MSDDLGDRAEALRTEVAGLREDVLGLRDRQARTDRRSVRTAFGAVAALLLVLVVGVTAYRGLATDRRIDALCPVLALVVGGAAPESRPAGAARDQYLDAIAVMRRSYTQLGCTTPLVPARTPGS